VPLAKLLNLSELKLPHLKRAGVGAQGVCPEFKPQYRKTKQNKKTKTTTTKKHTGAPEGYGGRPSFQQPGATAWSQGTPP
jgi:hypothetical protein